MKYNIELYEIETVQVMNCISHQIKELENYIQIILPERKLLKQLAELNLKNHKELLSKISASIQQQRQEKL